VYKEDWTQHKLRPWKNIEAPHRFL